MRWIWIPLLAGLGLGCFIGEELDRGDELMKQLGPGKRAERSEPAARAPAAPTPPSKSGPGWLERVGEWWDAATEPAPPPPDPSDALVACTLRGSVTFTRARDCELRGGHSEVRGGAGAGR